MQSDLVSARLSRVGKIDSNLAFGSDGYLEISRHPPLAPTKRARPGLQELTHLGARTFLRAMAMRHDAGYPSKKILHALVLLRRDQRGTIAVMMALLFPALIAILGLGMEVTNWYMQTRAMQNAADAAVIAAATNSSGNYNVEAAAVATQYGYTNGTNNATVTASNTATCPTGVTAPCYSVTISRMVPLYLTEVVGYQGNSVLNGAREQTLTSTAIANKPTEQQPICLLGLDTAGTAVRSNGGPTTDFTGCTVMSNSAGTCNGSNLNATMGLAHTQIYRLCPILGLPWHRIFPPICRHDAPTHIRRNRSTVRLGAAALLGRREPRA